MYTQKQFPIKQTPLLFLWGGKDCNKGQVILSSRLELFGCHSSELFYLSREDLLCQLGSVLALQQNRSHTMKMQARKMSEVSPCSSRHHRHLHYYLSSLFHIKKVLSIFISAELGWTRNQRQRGSRWLVRVQLGTGEISMCLQHFYTISSACVEEQEKKEWDSFPSKTVSVYGASH